MGVDIQEELSSKSWSSSSQKRPILSMDITYNTFYGKLVDYQCRDFVISTELSCLQDLDCRTSKVSLTHSLHSLALSTTHMMPYGTVP